MIAARYTQLRTNTINLKSLDQKIDNPIVAGGGDTRGRSLRLILTQEAEAMITPDTKIYLKWYHQKIKVRGYDLFKQTSSDPMIWEIKFPQNMLKEGNALACIQLVDDISISSSTNFLIHVLADVWDDVEFDDSDDITLFNEAVIRLNQVQRKAEKQLDEQNREFANMKWDLETVRDTANFAYDTSLEAIYKAESCTPCECDDIALEIKMNTF